MTIEKKDPDPKYMEVALRIKMSDWKKISKELHKKMWSENPIIKFNMDAEVLAFGRDQWISDKLERED